MTDYAQLTPEEERQLWEDELVKEGYIRTKDRPNPYNLPEEFLWNGLKPFGARLMNFDLIKETSPMKCLETIRNIPIRDDDVLIAAYSKSGTHWVWEVVSMLLNRTTDYEKRVKEVNMLEFRQDSLAHEKSPRVLNSHLWVPHLPQEILKKKTKIIHVVRNPKSVMVSYFFHMRTGYNFTLDSFMKTLIDNNIFEEENQLEYIRQMSEFQSSNPDHPIITVFYEHMKKYPLEITRQLAEFLGVPNSEQFYQQVSEACGFENMKKADGAKQKPADMFSGPVGQIKFYRRGTIGDWKNHLTVAQNEMMDAFIEAQFQKGGLDYEFVYT